MKIPESNTNRAKQLIWLYFWLLIIEGALRKWIVPSLSNPLLIIRDPVVILIYAVAASEGKFPRSAFIALILGLAFFSFLACFIVWTPNKFPAFAFDFHHPASNDAL